jgi:transcription elongation GreA/GreB family factor
VVEPSGSSKVVEFGSSVTIRRDDGRELTYRIVGTDEADQGRGTLSHISPLARALLGKAKGETVGAGAVDAEIVDIG